MVDYATTNNIDVGIAPTYLCLASLKEYASKNLIVLAQNVHFKDNGAYTGEVSCDMLNSIGVVGSIIGHSERRTYDNETSSKCNLKIKALLAKNLIPLYCVGETEEEFVANKTFEVIVTHENTKLGRGIGKSKKEAEQKAAQDALNKLAK